MSAFAYAQRVFLETLEKNIPSQERSRGILIGLSGGADSMLLLHLMHLLAQKENFKIFALHIHHGIRAEEADRDELFAKTEAEKRSVAFASVRINVPKVAEAENMGVEETARRLRYELFSEYAEKEDLAYIFTAHHATDHAETVLWHVSRGAGGKGLCGIPLKRKANGRTVFRPLLGLTAEEIRNAATEAGISFVTDSTNSDVSYTRNYVRNEILPRMRKLNPSLETAFRRMSENLSEDMDCLALLAKDALSSAEEREGLNKTLLLSMHPAIRYRVFRAYFIKKNPCAPLPERVHTDALFSKMSGKDNFSLSFPGDIRVSVWGNYVTVGDLPIAQSETKSFSIHMGENLLPDGGRIWLFPKNTLPFQTNVYNSSIHRDLSSATINGNLYVRTKKEGDAYRYGGVTHKLKKLFSDAKIPISERERIPIVCDEGGILWVPYFGVREDGGKKEERDLTFCYFPSGQWQND